MQQALTNILNNINIFLKSHSGHCTALNQDKLHKEESTNFRQPTFPFIFSEITLASCDSQSSSWMLTASQLLCKHNPPNRNKIAYVQKRMHINDFYLKLNSFAT